MATVLLFLAGCSGHRYTTRKDGREWRYVVIHHSATNEGNAKRFDRYHREVKGFPEGLGYHFVIGNGKGSGDGEVEVGRRWLEQLPGYHCDNSYMNEYSIGICLVGNFNEDTPTERQLVSLAKLIVKFMENYGIHPWNVYGHQDANLNYTECPGKNFPMKRLKKELEKIWLEKILR